MVVKSNFKQKNFFAIVFPEIRYSFLKHLILALGIKRVTRNSPTFLPYSKNKKQQKLLITTFLLVRVNLKHIANKSDSIGIATVYCGIDLISKSWMVLFLKTKNKTIFLACSNCSIRQRVMLIAPEAQNMYQSL